MRIFGIAILMLSATLADAVCDDTEIQSVGGSGEASTNHRLNGLSEGIRDNAFNRDLSGNELNNDLDCITVSGEYPGPGWSWVGNFHWMFIGGGGGGGAAVVPTQDKLDFCEHRDDLIALISAMPITGTAASGYSVAEGSVDWASAIFSTALRDIELWIGFRDRNYTSYTDGTVNWTEAAIPWDNYNNWQGEPPHPDNPNNEYPTVSNKGVRQVFMNFLHQTGKGSGTVDAMLANQDPQPEISCD